MATKDVAGAARPKAVRVRIAVAVDAVTGGTRSSSSSNVRDDGLLESWVADRVLAGDAVARHEADIPLPAPPAEVEGEVAP